MKMFHIMAADWLDREDNRGGKVTRRKIVRERGLLERVHDNVGQIKLLDELYIREAVLFEKQPSLIKCFQCWHPFMCGILFRRRWVFGTGLRGKLP